MNLVNVSQLLLCQEQTEADYEHIPVLWNNSSTAGPTTVSQSALSRQSSILETAHDERSCWGVMINRVEKILMFLLIEEQR